MGKGDYYEFKWFVGIVEDETTESRVRVRIFGVHPFDELGVAGGPASLAVSGGDLPWANLVYPIDSTTPNHDLQPSDWVYGFFADGDSCQQPVVVGRIARGDGSTGASFAGGTQSSGGGGSPNNNGSDPGAGGLSTGGAPPVQFNSQKYYSNIPGGSNQQKAFNLFATFFEEKGASEAQAKSLAAGVVASLIAESGSNLNPGSLGDTNTSSYAWGVAQWRLNRRAGLFQMCGHKSTNFDCQLNFAITELENRNHGVKSENSHRGVLSKIMQKNTPYDAAYVWTTDYEIPADRFSKAKSRGSTAQKIYDRLAPNYERATIGSPTQQIASSNAQ